MRFYVATDCPKRNTRNEDVIKKPNEWKYLEDSEKLEEIYLEYSKDKTVNTRLIVDDQLFYADIASMEIRSIYWEGPVFEMRRGLWYFEFGNKYIPCDEKLQLQLEQGHIKYKNVLSSITNFESYKKYPLFGSYLGQHILYTSEIAAYVVNDDLTTKVAQVVVGRFRKQEIWGTKLIREFSNIPKNNQASPRKPSIKGIPQADDKKQQTPDHLQLIVHGIGQQFFRKDGLYHFANDVAELRERVVSTMRDANCKERYFILPIQWREIVEFGVNPEAVESISDQMNDMGASAIEPKTDNSLLPSIDEILTPTNPYRTLIKDVCLDILLYMTEKHRVSMLKTVANELNRVHSLFMKNFPNFKGTISIIGHSLGTLIVFDLLTMEPKDFDRYNIPRLQFFPNALFLLGSPISMIRLLNGEVIRPMHCDASEGIKRVRVKYLYNIYHMYDPIAHRLEPLISRDFPKEPVPVIKPVYAKEGEENKEIAQLNPLRKRIDYVIFGSYLESAYQYLSALSQHSNYWTNLEVTSFIAKELMAMRTHDDINEK